MKYINLKCKCKQIDNSDFITINIIKLEEILDKYIQEKNINSYKMNYVIGFHITVFFDQDKKAMIDSGLINTLFSQQACVTCKTALGWRYIQYDDDRVRMSVRYTDDPYKFIYDLIDESIDKYKIVYELCSQ